MPRFCQLTLDRPLLTPGWATPRNSDSNTLTVDKIIPAVAALKIYQYNSSEELRDSISTVRSFPDIDGVRYYGAAQCSAKNLCQAETLSC